MHFKTLCAVALAAFSTLALGQQTVGFATLQPGTLNHTTASAIAKVLKEKAGLNVLAQPTAGDQVIVPMVARDEAEIGIIGASGRYQAAADDQGVEFGLRHQ